MSRLSFVVPVLWLSSVLQADGAMFRPLGESGPMVRSPRQEAVLATDGQRVQVILRTHFEQGPREVAWVVPVPARPTDIRAEQEGLFEELERDTAPKFTLFRARKPAFGCSHVVEDGGIALEAPVTVLETGSAGMYDYAVLSARDAGELRTWLNANGYAMPPNAREVLDVYTKGNWHWLAMKLRPGQSARPTLAPQPITYTYADTKLVFPMVISRISAAPRNEIVLYLLARQRYAPENWAEATVNPDRLERDRSSPSGTTYERVFAKLSERERQVFVTEYANEPSTMPARLAAATATLGPGISQKGYLTRLRAIIRPEDMDRDVTLAPAKIGGNVSNRIRIAAADKTGPAIGGVGTVVIIAAGAWAVERARSRRRKP